MVGRAVCQVSRAACHPHLQLPPRVGVPQPWLLQLRPLQLVLDQEVPLQLVPLHEVPDQDLSDQLVPDQEVPDQEVPFQSPPFQRVSVATRESSHTM